MYLRCLVVVLFSCSLMAQLQPGPAPGNPPLKADESKLPPDAVVITIEGICDGPRGTATKDAPANCKTVITREQFEKLADTLSPNMPPNFRRELASSYPRVLLFSKKAKEMGLDKDPRYQEMMKWASLGVLANGLAQQTEKKAADISDADVEQYYKGNPARFQQYELQRIFLPKIKPDPMAGTANTSAGENPADEASLNAEAKKIQAKAAAGGDFAALQKEAFDRAGLTSPSPSASLGKMTRGRLPKDHQKVFDLKPGQVSELFTDSDGFYIYRVVSEQMIPLADVKKQIHSALQNERMKASMHSLLGSITPELNPAYFGGPAPDDALPSPAPAPK